MNERNPSKAAWSMVCVPKEEGGLGVLDLSVHNESLLMKNLHKFFNHANIPWVHLIWENYYSNGKLPDSSKKGSFWWRDITKLLIQYKGIAAVTLGNGKTIFLWDNLWNNMVPRIQFPELFSFSKNSNVTILNAKAMQNLSDLFHFLLSEEAYQELITLEQHILIGNSKIEDSWSYIWGNGSFSSQKAYKQMKGHNEIHASLKWLWKSSCQLKHKIFSDCFVMTG